MTPRPLNVLLVSLTEMLNGAERVLLELAEGLDRERFNPVIAVPADGALSRAAGARGIDTVVVPAPRWLPFAHDPAPPSYLWRRYWSSVSDYIDPLAALIERRAIDVVYSASGTILHGALAALVSGRPHVHHLQEILGDRRLGLLMPRGRARNAYRIIGALSARVVLIGRTSQADAGDALPPSKVRIVPLGFRPAESTNVMPLPGPETSCVRVGILGGVWQPKGADLIVPIVRQVCEAAPEVHFYWAGPGDAALCAQLSAASTVRGVRHLHFLGYLDDVSPFLRAISFLLHPSRTECFPRALVEAALAGKPAIAARCGGPSEIIDDGVSGVLVPVEDINAMAASVVRLARDPRRTRQMGQHAAARASMLTPEKFIGPMQQVLAEAHAEGPVINTRLTRRLLSGVLHSGARVVPAARALRSTVGGRA